MKSIPLSLVSVLEFRHQSLTLKYIEIGLLARENFDSYCKKVNRRRDGYQRGERGSALTRLKLTNPCLGYVQEQRENLLLAPAME